MAVDIVFMTKSPQKNVRDMGDESGQAHSSILVAVIANLWC